MQRRVSEGTATVCQSGWPAYIGFLNERQQDLAVMQLQHDGWTQYSFFGGYKEAERAMLCLYEQPNDISFPLSALCLASEKQLDSKRELNHRDYLGSVLSLGLKRECVGDILVAQGKATIVLLDTLVPLVMQQLKEVAHRAITVTRLSLQDLETQLPKPQKLVLNVASLRLDAVLAAVLKCARSEAAKKIQSGEIQVNHIDVHSTHEQVGEGDLFSLRGHGRYRLVTIGGKSRKDRIFLEILKY